jgi:hypothetical protein
MSNKKRPQDKLAAMNPNHVLDAAIARLHLKNDAALSRCLSVSPPVISKIRHLTMPIGASLIVNILETANMSLAELVQLAIQMENKIVTPRRALVRPKNSTMSDSKFTC